MEARLVGSDIGEDRVLTVVLRGLGCSMVGLELGRRDEPDLAVKPSVVEPVAVFGDGDLNVDDGLPAALRPRDRVADALGLEQRVECLSHGVDHVAFQASDDVAFGLALDGAPGNRDALMVELSVNLAGAVDTEVGLVHSLDVDDQLGITHRACRGRTLRVVGCGARPNAAVDLGLADPVPQRFGMHPELVGDSLDDASRRLRVLPGVHRHPRRPLLELHAVLPRCCHDSHHPSQN